MFINDLQQELKLLRQQQAHHLKALEAHDNPTGILICTKHEKGFRWKRKYIQNGRVVTVNLPKTEKALAERLAVNLYRMICVKELQRNIDAINTLIRTICAEAGENIPLLDTGQYPGDSLPGTALQDNLLVRSSHELLRSFRNCARSPADFFVPHSPYRQMILSHLQREYIQIIDWYLSDYIRNGEHPEHLQFPVKLGFNVRSKSEVIIADALYLDGILFHYEERILLSDNEAYPDFNIPISLIERYIWEHHGAMDKDGYFYRAKGKINTYLDNRFFPGINMITTYETKQYPLTEEQVYQQLRWLKSRYRIAFPDLPPDRSFNLYDLAAYVKYQRIGQ